MVIKKKLFVMIMAVLFSQSAFAYIDPGTGSLLLQGLLAAIVGVLGVIKLYWTKISRMVRRLFKSRQSDEQ